MQSKPGSICVLGPPPPHRIFYSLVNSLNKAAAIRIFWVHVVKEQFSLPPGQTRTRCIISHFVRQCKNEAHALRRPRLSPPRLSPFLFLLTAFRDLRFGRFRAKTFCENRWQQFPREAGPTVVGFKQN
jgi:hypothetical protein